MESAVRESDRCFRWGGDEFVVVMSDTDRTSAAAVLERVSEAVTKAFEPAGGRAIELSWGLAEREPGASAEDLLAAADLALLEAKTDKRR
jgi:diguanylate cyclase (GGDEF)-like protein